MSENITPRKRKLLKGIVDGKTQRQAAIDAGYSPKTADSQASQILKDVKVSASLQDMMDAAGLSNETLLAKHVELLHAKRDDAPDYQVQFKALEACYKLKSAFVERKEITGANGVPLDLVVNFVDPTNG